MAKYYISTDAVSCTIEAASADAAAVEFAASEGIKRVQSAVDLENYLERVGGYGSMTEEESGEVVFDVPS